MTISQRLWALILGFSTALVVVTVLAIVQLDRVYSAANFGNENIVPSIFALDRAELEFSHVRVRIYRHVLHHDPKGKDELEAKIREAIAATEKNLKDYEPFVADSEDKRLLEVDRVGFRQYVGMVEQILMFSREDHQEQALNLLTEGASVAEGVNAALAAHMRYNEELGKRYADEGAAKQRLANWLMPLIAGLALVLAGGLGLRIRAVLVRRLEEANQMAARVARGDLSASGLANQQGHDELAQLIRALETMRSELAATVRQIADNTQEVSGSAGRLSSAAQQVSVSTQSQSSSTSAVAAAVEELTVSIDHVSSSAEDANGRAVQAGGLARDSAREVGAATNQINQVAASVEETAQQMDALVTQVQEIGKITTVIREVADQTNLLALNASIEAARAGEQGRGFAVVADEVRKLAERTTKSVHEISGVINAIQNGVNTAVQSMGHSREAVEGVVQAAAAIGHAMEGIQGAADTVSAAIGEISSALREQRGAATEVSRNVESIAQMSEENSSAVASVADTADGLVNVSDSLSQAVSRFRT